MRTYEYEEWGMRGPHGIGWTVSKTSDGPEFMWSVDGSGFISGQETTADEAQAQAMYFADGMLDVSKCEPFRNKRTRSLKTVDDFRGLEFPANETA